MSEATLLVCMYWGMQEIPSVRLRCTRCPEMVAIGVNNTSLDVAAICPTCFLGMIDGTLAPRSEKPEMDGVMVFGERIPMPNGFQQRIENWARDIVARRKRLIAIGAS